MTAGRFAFGAAGRRPNGFDADLITRLRALPAGPVPEPDFKADLRAQLVAITARIVAESGEDLATTRSLVTKPAKAGLRAGRLGASGVLRAIRRPVLAFASAATVLAVLLGLAVLVSSNALPGDSLYGVKRASEDVQLALAGSNVSKGDTYLTLAGRRVDEASQLLSRSSSAGGSTGGSTSGSNTVSTRTATLLSQALTSADSDARNGMQLLGGAAVAQLSSNPLAKLPSWLSAQRARLVDLSGRLPAGPLASRADASLTLLTRISQRVAALKANLGCPCLSQANSDDLGPLPCSPCTPLATAPGSGANTPTTAPSNSRPGGAGQVPGGTGSGGRGGGTAPGATAGSGGIGGVVGVIPGTITSVAPSGGLPAVPGVSSVLPGVSVGQSGVGVSGGPAQGTVGPGGVSVSVPGVSLPPVTVPPLPVPALHLPRIGIH